MVWVVQVVTLARTTSLDDMHSENIWFSWYKLSKYREKLICHACDGRTDGRRRKVENRAVFCWTRNRKRALAWVGGEGEGRRTGNTSNNVTTRASSRVQKDGRGAGGRTEVSWIDARLTQLRSIYDKMKE